MVKVLSLVDQVVEVSALVGDHFLPLGQDGTLLHHEATVEKHQGRRGFEVRLLVQGVPDNIVKALQIHELSCDGVDCDLQVALVVKLDGLLRLQERFDTGFKAVL